MKQNEIWSFAFAIPDAAPMLMVGLMEGNCQDMSIETKENLVWEHQNGWFINGL